jgi:hypothetical protein
MLCNAIRVGEQNSSQKKKKKKKQKQKYRKERKTVELTLVEHTLTILRNSSLEQFLVF